MSLVAHTPENFDNHVQPFQDCDCQENNCRHSLSCCERSGKRGGKRGGNLRHDYSLRTMEIIRPITTMAATAATTV